MYRTIVILIIAGASSLGFISCTTEIPKHPAQTPVTSKNELIAYLDSLEHRYERAARVVGLANWHSYANDALFNLDSAKAELAAVVADSATRKIIEEWRGRSDALADKMLARRLELWHRVCIGGSIYVDPRIASLENRLQQAMTNFNFRLNGTSTTRAKVSVQLQHEPSSRRRHELWSVPAQLSTAVSHDLLTLVTLRNEKAAQFGYSSYYSLTLSLNSIDEEWLIKTLTLLEEQTRSPFEQFVYASSKKLHLKKIGPWDLDYALHESATIPDKFFPADSMFPVLHRFERGIGFPVDSLPIKEYVKDIPYGGLNLAIDIPGDTRFLVNPIQGQRFYAVAFHEYGHALKAVNTHVEYPIFKGYEWIPGAQCSAYEEGVAEMHAEFTDDSLWIATVPHIKPKQIEKYIAGRGMMGIYRLRRTMKDFFIEYEMYKNPKQDMALLERTMMKKFLLVDPDSTEAPQYASSIWYVSYPCYYHNYIMASMIATQLQEALSNKFGEDKIKNPNVAEWMIDHLYANGEKQEWTERIRNATGKGLEPGALLRKLGVVQLQTIPEE